MNYAIITHIGPEKLANKINDLRCEFRVQIIGQPFQFGDMICQAIWIDDA